MTQPIIQTAAPACPAHGCPRARKRDQAFCRQHWWQLTPELRRTIWSTFRHLNWKDYLATMEEAKLHLARLEGRTIPTPKTAPKGDLYVAGS